MSVDSKKNGLFKLSADTSLLVERLRKVNVGETITWEELSDAISRDVRGEAKSNYRQARLNIMRDSRMVFDTVVGVGLIRLDDIGIVGTSAASMSKIHREARRGGKRLECASYDNLDNGAKIKLNAALAGFGALHELTKPKSIKKLEQSVSASNQKLPLDDTLSVFIGGKSS